MKKTLLKTKQPKPLQSITHTVLVVICFIVTVSCAKKDDDIDEPVNTNEISQEMKDLIYFRGAEQSSTVVITVGGGPSTELATGLVDYFSTIFNTPDILNITVHQAQTLNPNILEGNEMTLDQAIHFNAESVETLYQVATYFKNQGRTIYVAGISYGAFLTQELIAEKGIDVADKYLIMTGRLDMNDVFWQGLAEGKSAEFQGGVTPIVAQEPFEHVLNRNEARLFAGLIINRYTEQFNPLESLSAITYIYGETDEAVGRLTAEEIAFLQAKNAHIIAGKGGHDEPFEGFIERGFSEAFGIE